MKVIRPETETLSFTTVEDGTKLIITSEINSVVFDLLTIIADDQTEKLFLEVEASDQIVQIPLDQVEAAIKRAPGVVHSESWYERNVYVDSVTRDADSSGPDK